MENSTIKLGIIGTNFISDNCADAAALAGGIKIQAVFSRRSETGAAFAQKHGVPEVYTDFEAFAGSGTLDAIYVASPNYAHCAQSVQAMQNGKHVLCEKPIASNMAELVKMKAAAKAHGVVLLEAMILAHDPAYQVVKDSLGKIGTVRRAMFELCKYSSRYDLFRAGTVMNAFNPSLSNAAIMDIGVYCIHPCVKLFGKPQSIKATSVFLHNGMEGAGTVSLGYADMQADIIYSKITQSSRPCIIQGEEGTIVYGSVAAPGKIAIQYRDGSTQDVPCPQGGLGMVHEIREFVRLIHAGECGHNHMRHSELTMAVIDEARRQTGNVFPADE